MTLLCILESLETSSEAVGEEETEDSVVITEGKDLRMCSTVGIERRVLSGRVLRIVICKFS